MSTHAQRERLLLADLLERSGPDAPTLCDGWRTRDLAAHVVVRERRSDAAAGQVIPKLADRLERIRGQYAAKPYEELVQLIRTGPPRLSPFALKQLRRGRQHGGVLRPRGGRQAGGPRLVPRPVDPVFADALWSRLERGARMLGRRSPVGLVLRCPDGRTTVAHKGTPVVTVTGEPQELTMFVFGRQGSADVTAEGDKDAVAQAYDAKLGV